MSRLTPVAVLLAVLSIGAVGAHVGVPTAPDLTVHEWGTFTSIAGQNGAAVTWSPLDGAQDLPCFVERHPLCIKCFLSGTVRMETPVLYFYSPAATRVRVRVDFHQGLITEWYPKADVSPGPNQFNVKDPALTSSATWSDVAIMPGGSDAFPTEPAESHYYTARETDAAPLRSGSTNEKFLFYRGLGEFQPPISAVALADGRVTLKTNAGGSIGDVILLENRGGSIAYDVAHIDQSETTMTAPVLEGEAALPTAELERILVSHGLYAKEAKAMIATWRDSWFEEGARVIYIAPRAAVDGILPLTIVPRPGAIERVFVGRIELATSTTLREVRTALLNSDRTVLAKYGRFLRPYADAIMAESSAADAQRITQSLRVAAGWMATAPRCR
jgi:hypothetical protein